MLITVIIASLLAGLAMPLGAALASIEKIKSMDTQQEFSHGVMAFGGGALLSAIALVLVPEGIADLAPWSAALFFIGGGVVFMGLDILFSKINTPASQLAAMLGDFIPESIALGAAFATGSHSALLLAGLIALQNVPEGFNAYRELTATALFRRATIIGLFCLMALLGPIAGVAGYLWLGDMQQVIGAIMLFAAGGILYAIFQDIAPQVKLEKHYIPPMGALLGFVIGMLAFMITSQ